MRHHWSNALLGILAVSALAAALLTRQVVFVVVGAIAGGLLGFSIAGLRQPLPRALIALEGQPVVLCLWGAVVPAVGSITVESVNVIGAGLHVYFRTPGAGAMHLKVAQPRQVSLRPGQVLIGTARYVQWESKRIPVAEGVPAFSLRVADA